MDRYLKALAAERGSVDRALSRVGRGSEWRYKARQNVDFRLAEDRLLGRPSAERLQPGPYRDFRARYFGDRGVTEPHMEPYVDAYEAGYRRVLIIGPPEHARTTVANVQRHAHLAACESYQVSLGGDLEWPMRSAVLSATGNLAENIGWQLSQYLTDPFFSGELIRDYGPFKGTGRSARWTAGKLYFAWRGAEEKDPSIQFGGWDSGIQSARLTDLTLDDADDPAYSVGERKKLVRRIDQIFLPRLGTKGRLWYLCNRVDELDVAQELAERAEDGTWYAIIQAACSFDGMPCMPDTPGAQALWPGWIPLDHLKDARKQMRNDRLFSLVYLAKPVRDGAGDFPAWRLEGAKDSNRIVGHVPDGATVVTTMDPAASGGAAILTQAWMPGGEGKRYVVDAEWGTNRRSAGLKEWVREHLQRYRPKQFGLEAQGGGWTLFQDDPDLLKLCADYDCELVPLETLGRQKRDPVFGVSAMSELFDPDASLCRISIPWGDDEARRKMEPLLEQLRGWDPDSSAAADLVMALWFAQRLHVRASGGYHSSSRGAIRDPIVSRRPWLMTARRGGIGGAR